MNQIPGENDNHLFLKTIISFLEMNIFIIPSWYPDKDNPLDGIFIKEQVEALAEIFPEDNFIVSHCVNFYISITSISKSLKTINQFREAQTFKLHHKPNLIEFCSPAISWTDKLGGEIKKIAAAHCKHFLKAQNEFGNLNLIHAHVSYPGGFTAMKLKQKFNTPYIITEHMGPFPFERFMTNNKISCKISEPVLLSDEVIVPSSFQANKVKSFGFGQPLVIPNMINENIFFPLEAKLEKGKIKFLTITTFIESKGIKELLESILEASKNVNNCEFTISGTGNLLSYMQEFISANNLADIVTIIINPTRTEVIKLFRECDVFILTSRLETFGIVYIEAMACGKPVIATDCGGPADFINDDNGKLVQVGNVKEISEAIVSLTNNLESYDPDKIRKFCVENFSRNVVCTKINNVYKEVTGLS